MGLDPEPLFVAARARLVTKKNIWRRPFLINAVEFDSRLMCLRAAHEFVEAGFEARGKALPRLDQNGKLSLDIWSSGGSRLRVQAPLYQPP